MKIEEFSDKIQQIKDDLESVKDTVLTEAKRKEKIEEIKKRAEEAKEELEKKMGSLKDKAKEEAEALLESLNEIINVKLSILAPAEADPEITEDPEAPEESGDKPGFFARAKDWVGEQWNDVRDKEKWSEEGGKNLLRTACFAGTGVGLVALAYTGLKSLFGKEAREKRKKRREERRAERQRRKEEREATEEESSDEKPSFWHRPFGKFLKVIGIGGAVAGGIYGLLDVLPGGNLRKLHRYENVCKNYKAKAEECLRLSSLPDTNHENNKKNYDDILKKSLNLQEEANKIYDKISSDSKSKAEDKEKAENYKKNIDDYVEAIKAMEEEINSHTPDEETPIVTPHPEEGEEVPEVFKPVSAGVVTKAAMDFFDGIKEDIPADIPNWMRKNMKGKAEKVFNDYFSKHPIFKKSASKKMVFEIDDTGAFGDMIKDLFSKVAGILKGVIPKEVKDKVNDINKTLKEADTKTYEDIIFQYFGSLVANVVKSEKGTMTVQTYYDNITRSYPNDNNEQVYNDLVSSGQVNEDIKDMKYPFA